MFHTTFQIVIYLFSEGFRCQRNNITTQEPPCCCAGENLKMVSGKCRLCLSESLEIQSIFDTQLYQSVPLVLKIAVCTSLAVTQEDPFSKSICKECRMHIDKFYCFRENCMNNYIHLLGVECSRVTELEELIMVPCEAKVKLVQNKEKDKISVPAIELSNNLSFYSNIGKYHPKHVKSSPHVVSVSSSNSDEDDRRHLTDSNIKCQTSELSKELTESESVSIGEECVLEDNSENMYTEVDYSEFEVNVEADPQYTTTENIMEVQLGSNEEVERSRLVEVVESEDLLEQHLHFGCSNCLNVFMSPSALNRHYEEGECHSVTMQVVKEELLSSVDVNSQINSVAHAEAEREQSLGEGRARWGEKRKYPCETCTKLFNTRAGLLNHVRIHTGERPFLCSLCSRSFSQKGALLNHERKHRGDWPYPCQQCGKGFFRPSDLEKHIRSHTDERPFLCSICSKSFHQMSGLTVHERIHSGERPYSCSVCKMTFTQLSNKYRHMKTHADGKKPFACNICHRKFADKSELQLHQAVHQGAKPRICHYCNKGFRKPYELRDHLRRSHTNERPYTCELCNKSFFVAHDLKNHLYIHTGERPFSCAVCLQTFTQSGNLKRHHLRHHPDVPLARVSTKPAPFLYVQEVKVERVHVNDFDRLSDATVS